MSEKAGYTPIESNQNLENVAEKPINESNKNKKKSFLRQLGEGGLKKKMAGILLAGAIEGATACAPDMGGICENPNESEMSLSRTFEFEDGYELSAEQKDLVKNMVNQEFDKIEPAFRQGIDTIKIISPDSQDRLNDRSIRGDKKATGIYRSADFIIPLVNEIILAGPRLIDFDASRWSYYSKNIRNVIMHEVGHHVDNYGGIHEGFKRAGPTLFKEYYDGTPDFNGQDREREDAAEGFQIYRGNKYKFLLYYFQTDPKNIDKFRSLRDETFCGKDYPVDDPIMAYQELFFLYRTDKSDLPNNEIHDRILKAYETLEDEFKDERSDMLIEFYRLGGNNTAWQRVDMSLDQPHVAFKNNYETYRGKYEALRARAEAVQWPKMVAEIDYRIVSLAYIWAGSYFSSFFENERDKIFNEAVKTSWSVVDSRVLSVEREYEVRCEFANLFMDAKQFDDARKMLAPYLDQKDHISADHLQKFSELIQYREAKAKYREAEADGN
ncbi:MAG: hypothetical protein A3I29_02100 [Candidatus Magasanikbacteria bacterium RIFCSPLOWO2_02_FULL_44_11]|uniref:Uncharacterized protein n=2 Tax=Candidatus Magasanikiibacteriota TaxID=1752731 RepID=A0A1F6NAB3_9BACT|nr:MAG: hypothetical protein A3D53_03460 [Candidatus Magasanikbacteria bacterium RIFCSPHIGHO2_02_FULL_45_10]OGH80837.1 MAG: hypothetical protein A3I29_02100 [Candidatus Magasanikbacteria bacterium RIFCSPLOWO2_02_FULL_44_11]